jgi:hypothetical protein
VKAEIEPHFPFSSQKATEVVAQLLKQFDDGSLIDIKILVEHNLVEAFVGERAALTYRCYDATEYEIGLVVQDGNAEYEDITITK